MRTAPEKRGQGHLLPSRGKPKSPPAWARAPLYLAEWPGEEFQDMRVVLQWKYRRHMKKHGYLSAQFMCVKPTLSHTATAIYRFRYVFDAAGILAYWKAS